MTLLAGAGYRAGYRRAGRRRAGGRVAAASRLTFTLLVLVALGLTALLMVAYALWPRWADDAPATGDTPALPITVAGVLFNVPSQALRVAIQRRAGPQERIDLVYLWPALVPPPPEAPDIRHQTDWRPVPDSDHHRHLHRRVPHRRVQVEAEAPAPAAREDPSTPTECPAYCSSRAPCPRFHGLLFRSRH